MTAKSLAGFSPAFFDFDRQTIHPAEGPRALDGAPEEIVASRNEAGGVGALKANVLAGFVRDGFFYTREQAARAALQWGLAPCCAAQWD